MQLQIPLSALEPQADERPTAYADRMGRMYCSATSAAHRRQWGQYLTPADVADFMASLVDCDLDEIRILDPGCGSGVLACAVAEALAIRDRPLRHLVIDAYESDRELIPILDRTLGFLSLRLAERNVSLTYRAISKDFVLEHAAQLRGTSWLFDEGGDRPEYDVVVSNPPYFKLPKADPRSRAADRVVHGQPNIYALFMAVSAALLTRRGEMVFITPRSFASGSYFRRFRERFFAHVQLEAVHVFDSRRDAFRRDGVLQENIILKGRRSDDWAKEDTGTSVRVSVSRGSSDIDDCVVRNLPLSHLLDMNSQDKTLRIPLSEEDDHVVRRIDEWTATLGSYGMQISTGPVVPFRAVELLSMQGEVPARHAPLLWLQNVRPMKVEWPVTARNKPQYLSTASPDSRRLLVRDRNYVLLRRFSAKEEPRRLTAAPLIAGRLGCEWVGIENHLNYIHRPGGSLSAEEAIGLSVLLSSDFMDTYFRVLNGNTQVSATEVRRIPMPPLEAIVEIGRRAGSAELEASAINELAQFAFGDRPARNAKTVAHA